MKHLRIYSAAFLAALLWTVVAHAWSFGVCGDTRDDTRGIFPQILATVEESDMEFLIHTGDLEGKGGTKSWEVFRARTRDFKKPLHLVIGNHEIRGSSPEEFARFFGLPASSYSFLHKDTFFLLLDNAGGTFRDPVFDWLEKELAAHPKGSGGIAHIVVAMHTPPRTDGIFPHGTKRGYDAQSLKLLDILSRHKVDLVLCSHEHMHLVEDWNGIKVIVSGGGGAPIIPFQRYGFYRIDVGEDGLREKFLPVKQAPSHSAK